MGTNTEKKTHEYENDTAKEGWSARTKTLKNTRTKSGKDRNEGTKNTSAKVTFYTFQDTQEQK